VIEDIYADSRIPVDAYRSTFVKSLAMVPIRASDPIGAIGIYWATRRMPTTAEVKLLEALADSTSIALENIKLVAELEERVRERGAALAAAHRAESAARRELEERKRAEEALRRTEAQLRQAQKMEAVGRLAGGIAHDFNNTLSVILSYSALLLEDLGSKNTLRSDVEEIRRAGERASVLTRQLLAFSRQQVLQPRVLDVNDVLRGLEKMLRRVLGEDIDLDVRTHANLHPILADTGQIEQVMMNLVVNARDAMPQGGRLTIESSNVVVGEDESAIDARPGDYVVVTVTDTGIGMDAETMRRIFEPFFTTKPVGKGTGLGLASVYGIVKQSGGFVTVQTKPGSGTTFRVYLPRHASATPTLAPRSRDVRRLTGAETILLVEDDSQVRAVAREILRKNGYRVLEATDPAEALDTSAAFTDRIHLLLSDVVMPNMSGVQVAQRIASTRHDMRLLCMSGYTDEAVLSHGVVSSEIAFVQKPFTPDALLLKVREVLDAD
jgi:signal transduction histidine kinase